MGTSGHDAFEGLISAIRETVEEEQVEEDSVQWMANVAAAQLDMEHASKKLGGGMIQAPKDGATVEQLERFLDAMVELGASREQARSEEAMKEYVHVVMGGVYLTRDATICVPPDMFDEIQEEVQ